MEAKVNEDGREEIGRRTEGQGERWSRERIR